MPMPKLDALILNNVKEQLLAPERLATILGAIMERRSHQGQAVVDRRKTLEGEIVQKKEQLARLYQAIEKGVVDLDADLKGRVQTLKTQRDIAQGSLDRIADQARNQTEITPERLEAFSVLMHEKLDNGDIQARKAYLRSVISAIEVDDDVVRIIGEKAALANVIAGRQGGFGNVRGFVREWRALRDSNPCYRRERAASIACRCPPVCASYADIIIYYELHVPHCPWSAAMIHPHQRDTNRIRIDGAFNPKYQPRNPHSPPEAGSSQKAHIRSNRPRPLAGVPP